MNDIDMMMKTAMFLTNEFVGPQPIEGVLKNDIRKMAVAHISSYLLSDTSVSLDVKVDAFLQTLSDLKDTPSLSKVFQSDEEFHSEMDDKISEKVSIIKDDLSNKMSWGIYSIDHDQVKSGFAKAVHGLMQNQKFSVVLANNKLSSEIDTHNTKIMKAAAQEFIVEHNLHQQMHQNFLMQILHNATQYHKSLLTAFVQEVVQIDATQVVENSPPAISTQRLKRSNP